MANKKINQLDVRTVIGTSDLFLIGDASTGISYKAAFSDTKTALGAGVSSFNSRTGAVMPTAGDYTLSLIGDIVITSVANGNILKYNSTSGKWENVAGTTSNIAEGTNLYYTDARARASVSLTTNGISGAATYNSGTGVLNVPVYGFTFNSPLSEASGVVSFNGNLDDLGDVTITTPSNGQALKYNGTAWVNGTAAATLDDLTDVTLTSPTTGQVLKYNGTVWVNDTDAGGISSLNSQGQSTQSFATGTTGTDFGIASASGIHTFNIPDASATARGLVTTGTQTFAGAKTFSSAPTISTMTAGSVLFAGTSGALTQDNSNLFWDNTNKRLGIGTNATNTNNVLSLKFSNATTGRAIRIEDSNGIFDVITSGASLSHSFGIYDETNSAYRFLITSTGNVGIGTTTIGSKLTVNGTVGITGVTRIAGNTYLSGSSYAYHIDTSVAQDVSSFCNFVYNSTTNSLNIQSFGSVHASSRIQIRNFQTGHGIVLFSTGNVGIGSTPDSITDNGYKLDVIGTLRAQGTLTVSTGGASITGSTTITGSINGQFSSIISSNTSNGISATTAIWAKNDANFYGGLILASSANTQGIVANALLVASDKSTRITSNTGVTSGGSDPIDISPGGNNNNAIRIYSTGNVLIRTGGVFADSGYRLDVVGTSRFSEQKLITKAVAGQFSSQISENTNSATNSSVSILCKNDAANYGGLMLYSSNASNTVGANYMMLISDKAIRIASDAALVNGGTNPIDISPAGYNNTATRFFSSGNVLIQTGGTFTDAGYRLDVNGTVRIQKQLTVTGSTTAASAIARGVYNSPTLVAAANNDVLVALDISPTFTNGAYTGVKNYSLRINGIFNIVDSDIVLGTTIGTKIGTSNSEKLSFWNATPIVQPTTSTTEATIASPGAGSSIKTDDTFDGYTIAKVVKALRNLGILA